MPAKVVRFEPTPNPEAIKCLLSGATAPIASDKPRSYTSAGDAAAAGDGLGQALLAVPGVARALIGEGWLSVTRAPGAEWAPIKKGVTRAVERSP